MKQDKSLQNKKVLLLMPRFYYYVDLLTTELKERGAIVFFVENKMHAFDYVPPTSKFRFLRRVYHQLVNKKWHYLKKEVDWRQTYDLFICINGFSFDARLIRALKIQNPAIKTVLYLWDSMRMFDWRGIETFFDAAYTFDPLDASQMHINYLANFYPKHIRKCVEPSTIDLFFVGTQHNDRFNVLTKILANKKSYSYFIKLFIKYRSILNNRLLYTLLSTRKDTFSKNYCLNYKLVERIISADFLIYEPLEPAIIFQKMQTSRCILDIQAPVQAGLPHQMILALAMGKKIITTNTWIVHYDFYDPKQIAVIDRDHPIIDEEFLKKDLDIEQIGKAVQKSRLDNWLDELLSVF